MKEIREAVTRKLQEQEDHEAVVKLWEEICGAYESDGTQGAQEVLDALLPDSSSGHSDDSRREQ